MRGGQSYHGTQSGGFIESVGTQGPGVSGKTNETFLGRQSRTPKKRLLGSCDAAASGRSGR
eukprot:1356644-Pyramimonas_sp.AAC.1